MLSSQQGHALLKHIERTKARLILVGDKAQLPSVNSGRLFGLVQDYGIQTSIMDEIVRQKNSNALAAVVHATKGEAADALKRLEHVEVRETHEERVQWLANHWLTLPQSRRENTLIFAPTHKNREEITLLLRKGLEKEGVLQGDSINQITLKAKSFEAIQQRFVAYYQKGDVLRFNKEVPKNNIKSGHYYLVGEITAQHRNKNFLPLISEEGKSRLFSLKNLPQYKTHTASFERFIETYQAKSISIKEGETLLWGRNFKQDNIRNGERTILSKIKNETLVFKTKDGSMLELPKTHPALKHLDYGYVLTNHKVQGKDALYGIGLMESYHKFSATLNNFYVQISRAVIGITLITDNKERLALAISQNSGEKEASLDSISSQRLIQHEERFRAQSNTNIGSVIPIKISLDSHKHTINHEIDFVPEKTTSSNINYQKSDSTTQKNQPVAIKEKLKELEL
jgi:ATP-dependent exoDNAse (exonuclease V) alpha subunit